MEKETILETDHVRVVYNIKPVRPGHVLLIPKSHYQTFAELPSIVISELGSLLKETYLLLETAWKAKGFNVILQDGQYTGQSIPHLHVHVIPRTYRDMPNLRLYAQMLLGLFHRPSLSPSEMSRVVDRLRHLGLRLKLSVPSFSHS